MTKTNDLLATGALLAQDRLDRYRELGAFGGPVWQSAVQLRAMLVRLNRRHCADYFARPNFDPEQKVLRWTSEAPGTAVAWDAMSAEEQAERALDLEVVRSDLVGLVQELKARGGKQPGSAASFASLLEQAMKTPAQGNFLYFVGKQPVIAFWGFENQDNAPAAVAEAPPMYATSGPTGPVKPAMVETVDAAGIASAPPRRRPWWHWLLALLLLLLLLFFVLRSCMPQVLPTALAPAAIDAPAGARPPEQVAGTDANAGIGRSVHHDASGNVVREGGSDTTDAKGEATTTPADMGTADAKAQADAKAGENPPPELPQVPPADAQKNAEQDQKAEPPAPDPKPTADKTGDNAGNKANDKTADKSAMPMTDAPDMEIPKDPGAAQKMDFLQGKWKTGAGLVDTADKKPVDVSFDIGKDGKGEATYRKADGTVCKAPIQGVLNGGKVSIAGKDQVPCSGGGSFQAPRIECARNKRGETECSGVNADKSTFTTRVQKQP